MHIDPDKKSYLLEQAKLNNIEYVVFTYNEKTQETMYKFLNNKFEFSQYKALISFNPRKRIIDFCKIEINE